MFSLEQRSNNRIGESFDRPGPAAALVFPTKFEEKPVPVVSPVSLVESDKGTKAFPMMSLQPNFISPVRNPGGAVRLPSDVGNAPSQPRSQACQTRSRATIDDQRKEDDMAIEGGTISISSAYSKGWEFIFGRRSNLANFKFDFKELVNV